MIETKERIQLPMMALRGLTVFPNMAISFPVGRQKSLDALEVADEGDKRIFLVAQRDPEDASPEQMGLYEFGTVATIKQILKLPGNMTHVIVEGVIRGRLETVQHKRKCDYAEITTIARNCRRYIQWRKCVLLRICMKSTQSSCPIPQQWICCPMCWHQESPANWQTSLRQDWKFPLTGNSGFWKF